MKTKSFKIILVGILTFSFGTPFMATAKKVSSKKEEKKQKQSLADLESLLNKSFESFNKHKKQEQLFSDLEKGGLGFSQQGQKFLWNDLNSPAPKVKVQENKFTLIFPEAGNAPQVVEIEVLNQGKDLVLMVNNKKFSGKDLESMSNLRAAMVKSFIVDADYSSVKFLNFFFPMAHANSGKENWFTNNLGFLLMGAGAAVGIFAKNVPWSLGLVGAGGLWMLARTVQDNNPGSKPTGGHKSDDFPVEAHY